MTSRLQHTVYRVDSGMGKNLANTNSANKLGLVYMLEGAEFHDKHIGDHISVYEVSQSHEFGRYQPFRKRMPQPTNNPLVGMKVEKVIDGQEAIYYSFPEDGDWEAQYRGSIPLKDFEDACDEENGGNDLALDEQVEVLNDLIQRL
jgi:hypothetical protein